jgi:hypothetical protein
MRRGLGPELRGISLGVIGRVALVREDFTV